jgi:hypothetical protein
MTRIKTVFGGNEIAHIFASRSQYEGRSAGNMSFRADVLYSYAAPIAAFWGDIALINPDRYSNTTSKHQARALRALSHFEQVYIPYFKTALDIVQSTNPNKSASLTDYMKHCARDIAAARELLTKKRSENTRREVQADINRIDTAAKFLWNTVCKKRGNWENAVAPLARAEQKAADVNALKSVGKFVADFNFSPDYSQFEYYRLNRELQDNLHTLAVLESLWKKHAPKAARLMGAEWAKDTGEKVAQVLATKPALQSALESARAVEQARVESEKAELIEKWLNGEGDYIYGVERVFCRVIEDEQTLETSKGARVPLDGAKAIARMAKICRESGQEVKKPDSSIGPYKGLHIDANGTIRIQCHVIEWDSIAQAVARFAPDTFNQAGA